jgi:hypothetical protein
MAAETSPVAAALFRTACSGTVQPWLIHRLFATSGDQRVRSKLQLPGKLELVPVSRRVIVTSRIPLLDLPSDHFPRSR